MAQPTKKQSGSKLAKIRAREARLLLAEKKVIASGLQGFTEFIRQYGVIGLAIGIIIGGAVTNLVKALVDDLIDPLLGLIEGRVNLENAVFHFFSAEIRWGHFVSALIDFISIAFVIFYGFKWLKFDKLDKKKS